MKIPIIGKYIDERFLDRRRRSTAIAGLAAIVVAYGLFMYHYLADHIFDRDLFIVIVTMAVVKIALMTWYLLTD